MDDNQSRRDLADLVQFLTIGNRADIQEKALTLLLSLSSDEEFWSSFPEDDIAALLNQLCLLLPSLPQSANNARALSFSLMTNLTATQSSYANYISLILLNSTALLSHCLNQSLERGSTAGGESRSAAVHAAQLLSNLSRSSQIFVEKVLSIEPKFPAKLIDCLCFGTNTCHNNSNVNGIDRRSDLDTFIGFIFINVTAEREFCAQLPAELLPSLFALLSPTVPLEKRKAVLNAVYNTAKHDELHSLLLRPDHRDTLLTMLVGPLADKEDQLSETETAQLPPDLQYWEHPREREPAVLGLALSTLYQLCATRFGRELLRQSGLYPVLREMDKALSGNGGRLRDFVLAGPEEQGNMLRALVGVLLRTEEEMGPGMEPPLWSIRPLAESGQQR